MTKKYLHGIVFLLGLGLLVSFSNAQDTTESGFHVPKKRKQVKQKVLIPQKGEGIKTLIVGGKPQLELRREDQTSKPPSYTMETVVVTSERLENQVAFTTNSSSVVSSNDIQNIPSEQISDVLNTLPGFLTFSKDGLGRDAITTTRGFYGGGESEYLAVYVNGIRINDLETGIVDWNTVSAKDISKIEVVRGPSSPLYGDVGIGGVVNITTKEEKELESYVGGSIGSFGSRSLDIRSNGRIRETPFQFYLQSSASDGFRNHSDWGSTNIGGELTTIINSQSKLVWSLSNRAANESDPGPLVDTMISINREASDAAYSSDGRDENKLSARVDYFGRIFNAADIRAGVYTQDRNAVYIRTLPAFTLDPSFDLVMYSETKERNLKNQLVGIDANVTYQDTIEDIPNKFIFGGELESGKLRSTYYNYSSLLHQRTGWFSNGEGSRQHVGLFIHDEVPIIPTVKMNGGFRFDNYNDSYDVATSSPSHTAFSPKVGVNYIFYSVLENDVPIYTGNLYANIIHSFKTPTLDQLFDQRGITIAYSTRSTSNLKLKPQQGWNFEIGVYQRGRIIERKMYGEMVSSFYLNPVKDEIDFDLATYKYANIQNTRHFGFENGFRLHWVPNITAFLNLTYTSSTFTDGANKGNQLKAIPKIASAFGITYHHRSNVTGTLTWNYIGMRYFDDTNLHTLSPYNTVNIRISYKRKELRAYIDFENIIGAEYNSTGYILTSKYGLSTGVPLPIQDTRYLYPHAPTTIRLGVEATLDTPWFVK